MTLEAMLAAREQRVARQQAALARFARPLLSLTLVSPGPVKDGVRMRYVFSQALAELEMLFGQQAWAVLAQENMLAATGPEALLVVDCPAQALKAAAAILEDCHPLGRLWDMDVIAPELGALSRAQLGLAARRCLICGEAAHACARSRAHSLDQLQQVIEDMVDGYRRSMAG